MFFAILNPGSDSLKYSFFEKLGKEIIEITSDTIPANRKLNFPLLSKAEVIGIRVVHGGTFFREPTKITSKVLKALESLIPLAPLHNPVSIKYIKELQKLYPKTPLIACFDTEFHKDLPDKAAYYGIPHKISKKYNIRRFGFHGFAHEWMLEEFARIEKKKKGSCNIITVQLGSGCSLCAIQNGKSVDTSMGFSPLEGPIMRTRSGSIDASIVFYLLEQKKWKPEQLRNLLFKDSGLKGIGGHEGRINEILKVEKKDLLAKEAIDIFCYEIQKLIGSYIAILPRLDGIVFSGGISEYNPLIIERILKPLKHLGVQSEIPTYRVEMNENMMMAKKIIDAS